MSGTPQNEVNVPLALYAAYESPESVHNLGSNKVGYGFMKQQGYGINSSLIVESCIGIMYILICILAAFALLDPAQAKIYNTRFEGTTWDDETWRLTTTTLDQGHYQSRMSLSNGYLGINLAAGMYSHPQKGQIIPCFRKATWHLMVWNQCFGCTFS